MGSGYWGGVRPGVQELFLILHCVPSTCSRTWRVKTTGRMKRRRKWQWTLCVPLCGAWKAADWGQDVPEGTLGFSPQSPARQCPEPLSSPGALPHSGPRATSCQLGGQRGPAGCSPSRIFRGGGERGPRRPRSLGVRWEPDPVGCCEMEPPVNFV